MTEQPEAAPLARPRTIIEEVREEYPWLLDGYEPGYRAGWHAALIWAGIDPKQAGASSDG